MTLSNVCACEVDVKGGDAFLCSAHEHLVPPHLRERSDKAARAVRAHRAIYRERVPDRLAGELATAYRLCRDAARAHAPLLRAVA